VKTDSLFFRIFQSVPGILFELIGEPFEQGQNYEFRSLEIKQTAFRLDGILVPKPDSPEQTVIFVEVQFQKDEYLYDRMFAEIGMYLMQNRPTADWRAIAIFPRKSLEPKDNHRHRSILQGEQFQVIYLEDFLENQSDQIGIQLMQLIVSKPKESETYARRIVDRIQTQTDLQNQVIIELISTVMVYKFPELSWEAIEAMFGLSELKQTRVYQQALQEGRQEGRQEGEQAGEARIVLRLLTLRIGELSPETQLQVQSLSSRQLESLSEALLNFSQLSDLQDWLQSN
jgi:predicted transposase/invertase (TIGR01784 family)